MKYNISVFIGRFQPVHLGHLHVITQGLEQADHMVVLIGSSGAPRSHRNPFTFEERREMVYNSIPSHMRKRVLIKSLEDAAYNDSRWIHQVQSQVTRAAWEFGYTNTPTVALVGHSKDSSSYYLKLLPQYDSVEVANFNHLDSTQIRNVYFSNIGHMWIGDADGHKEGDLDRDAIITPQTRQFLIDFMKTPDYNDICAEYDFVAKYRLSWSSAPYPVNLVCVDACVIKSGHILLVKRGAMPGKGLWAMPGGYLNVTETALDGMIRELREETKIKVPEAVLRGSIVKHEIFDDPNRSARGRVLTIGYLIDLGTGPLDKIKGSDDAISAKWIPLADVKRDVMFEDHYSIIEIMVGI